MKSVLDGLLHVPMGLAFAFPLALVDLTAWFVGAAIVVFAREVTQEQAKRDNFQFTARSLAFWKWSGNKNVETWIPIAILASLAFVI